MWEDFHECTKRLVQGRFELNCKNYAGSSKDNGAKIQLSEHPAQIRTQRFPNTSSQRYSATSLLGTRNATSFTQAMAEFRISDEILTYSRLWDVGNGGSLAVIKV
jgi:hypothetical protein